MAPLPPMPGQGWYAAGAHIKQGAPIRCRWCTGKMVRRDRRPAVVCLKCDVGDPKGVLKAPS